MTPYCPYSYTTRLSLVLLITMIVGNSIPITTLAVEFDAEVSGYFIDSSGYLLSGHIEIDNGSDIDLLYVQQGDYITLLSPGNYVLTGVRDGGDELIHSIDLQSGATLQLDFIFPGVTQVVGFDTGWNRFALTAEPTDNSPESVFEPLIQSGVLLKVIGPTTNYDPALPAFLNTLTEIESTQGYWVNVSDAATFIIEAPDFIDPNTETELDAGWNHMGFFLQEEVDVAIALSAISDNLIKVIGEEGNYDPMLPPFMNTLTTLKPGLSYDVEVNSNVTLIYSY